MPNLAARFVECVQPFQCEVRIFRERMLLEESSVEVERVGPYVHTAVQRIVRRERGTAVKKLRIVFGWEVAHAAVSRRPPVSLYTYAASVWDLSIV